MRELKVEGSRWIVYKPRRLRFVRQNRRLVGERAKRERRWRIELHKLIHCRP